MATTAVITATNNATPAAHADTYTVAQNALRTAWDSAEPALTQSPVSSPNFGQLFATQLSGQIYASPLVANHTVITATQTNNVYGLDGETGAVKWSRLLGPAWNPATLYCGDISPSVGVTSTPVYDPSSNTVYLTAKTNDGTSATTPNWYMHALDATTGSERSGWPVRVSGAPSNDPSHPFNSLTAAQRPGLLLLDGVVYAGFASYCDRGPYVGYVVGISTAGHQTAMWSTESGNSFGEGGIWQSGAGLVSDGPRQIIFATGNGVSPQPSPGTTPPPTLAESVVRLTVQSDGSLKPTDFFSPANNAKLDQDDTDLGSGGPIAIPDGYGTAAHPHLLVQMGKDGKVYLLDRDRFGGMAQGSGGGDAILSAAGPYNGVWGRSAFLGTSNGGYIYNVGNNGYLRAFRISPTAGGGVALAAVGATVGTFPYGSGSPLITSNGQDGSTALVWTIYQNGAASELRALRALPNATGILQQVFSAPIGTATKFSSVTSSDGRVYVGTKDGKLFGFGAPTHAAVGATGTDLGSTPVDRSSTGSVTVTAARDVTLSSITSAAPFSATIRSPIVLAKGATASIPVTFAPTTVGSLSGTLALTTSDGETVKLDVHGLATRDGLAGTPGTLTYTDIPTGSKNQQVVNIANTGTTAATITGVTLPTSPSLAVDATTVPQGGEVLQPQQAVAISITYAPTDTAAVSDSLVVTADTGSTTVPITATAVSGSSHLSMPSALDFGQVAVGLARTLTFPITNSGNIAMTITKAKAPAGIFSTTRPIAEGLSVPPGTTVYQSVTFTPTARGVINSPDYFYLITTDDGNGAQQVHLTGTGVDDPIAPLAEKDGGSYSAPLGMYLNQEYTVGAAGRCQDFTWGVICYSPTTGLHEVRRPIGMLYKSIGGPRAPLLGMPVGDQFGPLLGGGYGQQFQNGAIYYSPASGAHTVTGAIKAEWVRVGWESGAMGYPTGEPFCGLLRGGCAQYFQNGSIYWSPGSGAHFVRGAIKAKWGTMGWERGMLGYPISDEFCGLRDGGCGQHFQNGSVYWSLGSGAHYVRGGIRERWKAQRWESGSLGYPVSDEFCGLVRGGCGQHFQHGSIYWSPSTPAVMVVNPIRAAWGTAGWEHGRYGYPIGEAYHSGAYWYQRFQGGTVRAR